MDGVALNNPMVLSRGMTNTKKTKKEVLKRIKEKLENAKLELIYTELEEMQIPFEKKYKTVKELTGDIKGKVGELDYNKIIKRIEEIELSLEKMVKELENNSTSAFTKFMTSDLAKTVAKTIGISLAGRTALILAPTIGTKALVGAGLAGYGLYRIIKTRKEVIQINETNELNNILMDLETTKDKDQLIDTRFNEDIQKIIREFLKNNDIKFEDTGYRSLRQTIYALNNEQKRSLCNLLNMNLDKGIDIDKRINTAKRKLNVVATSASAVGAGALLGSQVAGLVNSFDPGLAAGVLNGTVLSAWLQSVTGKEWFAKLAGGLGLVGSEVLQHIPVIGTAVQKVFAAENLAAFSAIGAAGGLAVGAGLGIASAVERIHTNKKTKEETEKFLKLDAEKYAEIDKPEFEKIQAKLNEPQNILESVIVDIVLGYLRDNNVKYEGNPQTVQDLKQMITTLPMEHKKRATEIMNQIYYSMDNDPDFVKGLKKAGKISIGLFTAGLAVMSVYDIIKGGAFLPEISQKLFPDNNIHAPVQVPEPLDYDLDTDISPDKEIYAQGEKSFMDLLNDKETFMIPKNGDYYVDYAATLGHDNPGLGAAAATNKITDYGQYMNLWDQIKGLFGVKPEVEMVPSMSLISARLEQLSSNQLYNFYRYFNTLENDGSQMYSAIRTALGYSNFLDKATSVITAAENTEQLHNIVNNVTEKIASGAIPFATGVEILGLSQKKETSNRYSIPQDNKNNQNKLIMEKRNKNIDK